MKTYWCYGSCLLLMCLWDVYHVTYGKVWDVAAFFLIAACLFFNGKIYKFGRLDLFPLFFVLLSGIGFLFDPRAQLGVGIGLFAYVFFRQTSRSLDGMVAGLVIFVAAAQLIDGIAYFWFGEVLKVYPGWFLEKRNFDGSSFFRPTGFFAEANAISVTMLMLLGMVSSSYKYFYMVFSIVVISVIFSFSLFGFFSGLSLLAYFIVAYRKFNWLVKLSLCLVIIFMLGNFSDYLEIFFFRLSNFFSDPSFVARFGLDISYGIDVFVPQGFRTDVHSMEYYAANGMLSLVYASGLFLPVLLATYISSAPDNRRLLIYLLLLVANPVYTTALFWAMLGYNRSVASRV